MKLRSTALGAFVCGLLLVGATRPAHADETGFTLAAHAAYGWRYLGPVGESALYGGGASFGFYNGRSRAGIQGQLLGSTSFRATGLDVGGYFSFDALSVSLDNKTSLAAPFFRLDGLVRNVLSRGDVGGTFMLSAGIRALGISFAIGMGPELGLAPNSNKLGISSQVRLEFDFIEGLYALRKIVPPDDPEAAKVPK